jgi:hypothetical protein
MVKQMDTDTVRDGYSDTDRDRDRNTDIEEIQILNNEK